MKMTRRVMFSAAHTDWLEGKSPGREQRYIWRHRESRNIRAQLHSGCNGVGARRFQNRHHCEH